MWPQGSREASSNRHNIVDNRGLFGTLYCMYRYTNKLKTQSESKLT